MNPHAEIEHNGIVHSISVGTITVRITSHPACSSCSASGICSASGGTEKYFEVSSHESFTPGQEVKIVTSLRNGFSALTLGYLLPLGLLLAMLILMLSAGAGEVLAGIGSVVSVALYYLGLYLWRDKIAGKIQFTIKPV